MSTRPGLRRHAPYVIWRGVHRRIRFMVRQAEQPDLPFNLAGCGAAWSIGPSYAAPPVLVKATGGQGITIDVESGWVDVLLGPADAASLTGGAAFDQLVITDDHSETDVAAWGPVDVIDLFAG